MTAAELAKCGYLDHLAETILLRQRALATLTCTELRDAFRFADSMNDRGVSGATLRQLGSAYALRVDALGPEEFDRRAMLGLAEL